MSETQKPGLSYRDAGVDIDAQDDALDRIKKMVSKTKTAGTLSELGSFGGLFSPQEAGYDNPILVSSADGVGTKLKVAFMTGIHNTVGRDLVNHCVNDILVQGAEPLFFMDYVATGRLDPQVLADVVEGVAQGCLENGCSLLGGETAEMPGFYGDNEYDVAGFVVGAVTPGNLIDGSTIKAGDRLVGLPSAGLHTNGFSLARKVFFELEGHDATTPIKELGASAGEILLREHRTYLPQLRVPLRKGWIKGLAHITGGGLTDNLPRVVPDGLASSITKGSWPILSEFTYLQEKGNVDEAEMYRAFNMGIGMVVVVSPEDHPSLMEHFKALAETTYDIGVIKAHAEGGVFYE